MDNKEIFIKHGQWVNDNIDKIMSKQLKYCDSINEHQFNDLTDGKLKLNQDQD